MTLSVRTCATLAEAAQAMSSARDTRFLGGGTLVMRAVNEGDVSFSAIVRTSDRAFRRIETGGARVTLGAGTTMADILASRDLAFLASVARAVGGPAVREAATVGGNLFAPTPYGDMTTALLALDATVAVASGFGQRDMALEEFLRDRARVSGLVASVSFQRPADPGQFRYAKVSRVHPKGVGVLSIAAHLPQSSGRIAGARIAYCNMAPTPVRAKAAERALDGRTLDAGGIADCLRAALDGTSPATDALATEWYRREVLPVHLKRLLLGERS